ncbi:MAG: SnoaL-like domain-containing protein [Acaryochloris sp. RU_4_1]|nr:SnoaL-like domain-containing protein [Acaryochloris sp. RU_4_1]NJR54347.1 SnoaL-like domain-containing protein [Acaryochloris sp. CRU_2_0]
MTTETTQFQNEDQIRGTIDARAIAIRNKNVQGVLPNFTEDSVGFFFEPPLQQSPLKEDLAGWFATWSSPIGYEIGDLKITAGDDVAFCNSLSRLTGTRTDGTNTDLWFRETLCFQKIDDQWRIAHIHESVPMYMDGSLKAAIDLKP